jgi:hypothetical protein
MVKHAVPMATSTVQVADTVKELDMSMPSYDEIKPYKASVENVKSLSVTSQKGGNVGVSASEKKKSMPLSSVLPSMGKKGPKQEKTSPEGYTF